LLSVVYISLADVADPI